MTEWSGISRADLLLAIDGLIAQAMTVRAIVAEKVPGDEQASVAPIEGQCPHPPGRRGQTVGSTYCRDCGETLASTPDRGASTDAPTETPQ